MRRTLTLIAVPLLYFALGLAAVRLGWPPDITITWETASEVDTAGFLLYRGDAPDGPFTLITETPIPARGDPLVGASYQYTDQGLEWGKRYFYRLEEVERTGEQNLFPDLVEWRAGAGWPWALGAGATLAAIGGAIAWYSTRGHRSQAVEDSQIPDGADGPGE